MMNPDNRLPIGLGIGPMRTGSTWLYEYLLSRNDVCLPKGVKETFYFSAKYEMGESWYKNHFNHYDPDIHHAIIEICPTLFHVPEAVARVKKTLSRPVLLVTLRDPVDRAWSHYMHLRQYGETALEFDVAVRKIPSIVIPGLYARYLARWVDEFGREAVHVTFFDDLKQQQPGYVQQVDAAFDLPPMPLRVPSGRKINAGSLPRSTLLAKTTHRAVAKLRSRGLHWIVNAGKRIGLSDIVYGRSNGRTTKPTMNADAHGYLVEQFSADIENLEKILDIDLDSWRRKWARFGEKSSRM